MKAKKLIGYTINRSRDSHIYGALEIELIVDTGYGDIVLPVVVGSLKWQTDAGRRVGTSTWYGMAIRTRYESERSPDCLADLAALVKRLTYGGSGYSDGAKYFAAGSNPTLVIENLRKAKASRMVYDVREYGHVAIKDQRGVEWGKWSTRVLEKGDEFCKTLGAGSVWARDEAEARRLLLVELAGGRHEPEKAIAYFVQCGMPVVPVNLVEVLAVEPPEDELLGGVFPTIPEEEKVCDAA